MCPTIVDKIHIGSTDDDIKDSGYVKRLSNRRYSQVKKILNKRFLLLLTFLLSLISGLMLFVRVIKVHNIFAPCGCVLYIWVWFCIFKIPQSHTVFTLHCVYVAKEKSNSIRIIVIKKIEQNCQQFCFYMTLPQCKSRIDTLIESLKAMRDTLGCACPMITSH